MTAARLHIESERAVTVSTRPKQRIERAQHRIPRVPVVVEPALNDVRGLVARRVKTNPAHRRGTFPATKSPRPDVVPGAPGSRDGAPRSCVRSANTVFWPLSRNPDGFSTVASALVPGLTGPENTPSTLLPSLITYSFHQGVTPRFSRIAKRFLSPSTPDRPAPFNIGRGFVRLGRRGCIERGRRARATRPAGECAPTRNALSHLRKLGRTWGAVAPVQGLRGGFRFA